MDHPFNNVKRNFSSNLLIFVIVTVVHVCSAPKSTHYYFILDLKSMKKIIKGLQQYTLIFFLHCCHTLVKQFFY